MGFVKTPEEVDRILKVLGNPTFHNAQVLTVDYLTDPAIVARLLPAPLQPAREPVASARIGRWQSNCVGDFTGGALYLRATHNGREGDYVLAMFMDGDAPVIIGREVFGEPKKLATAFLTATSTGVKGWVERRGTRIIELDAHLTEDLDPARATGVQFCVKAWPAADGSGLESDAVLTESEYDRTFRKVRTGTASVRLRGTPHDPVDEVVVDQVVRAVYVEGDFSSRGRAVARIPAADFLPYALGRSDDYSLLEST